MRAAIASLLGCLAAASAQPFTPDVDLGERPPQRIGAMNSLSVYAHGTATTERPFVIHFEPNAEAHPELPEEPVPWFFSTCTEGSYEGINYQGGDHFSDHLVNNTGTDVLPDGYMTYMEVYQGGDLVPTRLNGGRNAVCPSRGRDSVGFDNKYAASEDVMLQPHLGVDVVLRLACRHPVCEDSPPLSHHFELYSRAIHPDYSLGTIRRIVPRMVGGIEYTVTGSVVIEGISGMDNFDDDALAEDLSKLAADATFLASQGDHYETGGFRVTHHGFLVGSTTRGFRFFPISQTGACVKHIKSDGTEVAAYAVQFVGQLIAPPTLDPNRAGSTFYSNRMFEETFKSGGVFGRNFKYANLRLRPGVTDVSTGAICGRIGLGDDVPGPLDEENSVGWDLCGEPYEEVPCPGPAPGDDDGDGGGDDDAGLAVGEVAGIAAGAAVGGAALAGATVFFFTKNRADSSTYQEPLM